MSFFARAVLASALAGWALPAAAIEYRAQAHATWADNLSRTSFAPTQQDAAYYTLALAAVQARQLAPSWTLLAAAEFEAETVPDFTALDRLAAGARLTSRHKFGLGPMAPVLDVSLALARHDFRENDRTGWKQEATLALSKRFTETLRVAVSGGWTRYDAANAPFDLRQRRLTLEAYWDASARWRLSAGAGRQWGHVVANAAWSVWGQAISGGLGAVVQDYYTAIPWDVTNTFGPGWVAYRVEADVDTWWAETSFAVTERTVVPFRYEAVKAVNRIGVRYDSAFVSLGVAHRF